MRRLFSFPWRSRGRIAADVENELAFHLDSRIQELVATGATPDDARRRALVEFGDLDDARRYMLAVDREIESAQRRREYLREILADIRYAGRRMRAAPVAFRLCTSGGVSGQRPVITIQATSVAPVACPHSGSPSASTHRSHSPRS